MTRLRRLLSRIGVRLLAWNALLVFLPAAGVLFLDTYEQQLLADQERAMVAQGRVLAAALSGRGALRAEDVVHTLVQLDQRTGARIRVVDPQGVVLADSSRLGPQREAGAEPARTESARGGILYRLGSLPFRLYRRYLGPPAPPIERADVYASGEPLLGPEVRTALRGRYGAATRISGGQRSVTLYSAIPVRDGERVAGAVLVSQSTYRILQALYEVRAGVARVFLLSLGVAVVLSLLLSTTIARPLARLRNEAEAIVDRRGRLRGRLRAPARQDEIGDLGRALEQLTARLEDRVAFVEAFASDVSHEFKNPLASIRTATEMLSEVEDPAERKRFLHVVEREIARMEHLLSGVRELSRLDADAAPAERGPIDVAALLAGLVEAYRMRGVAHVDLRVAPGLPSVIGSAERLTRVFENVIDNAVSFSPPGGRIAIEAEGERDCVRVRVLDGGPGIPDAHRERIFHRFFSYRPGASRKEGGHAGLGLAIARALVESAGGTISAASRPEGGACFEIRLPFPRRARTAAG